MSVDAIVALLTASTLLLGVIAFIVTRMQTGRFAGTAATTAYREHVIHLYQLGLSCKQIEALLAPEDLEWCYRSCGTVKFIVDQLEAAGLAGAAHSQPADLPKSA